MINKAVALWIGHRLKGSLMANWFGVCEIIGGELKSVGTVIADPLPAGLEAIALAGQPDFAVQMWDKATKSIVAKPAPPPPRDRVNDILTQPEMLLLNTLNRDRASAAIDRVLTRDDLRYY